MEDGVKRVLTGIAICCLAPLVVAAVLVAVGRVSPPPVLAEISGPFARMDLSGLPPIERYRARDGAELAFRSYPASGDEVAVLIHGSAGSSTDMHQMAKALQSSGITVYVPDLRGHGANYPHGDIAYTGQLDDDMADFLQSMRAKLPGSRWTLVGFSSGGGFALRIAGGRQGREFDRYLLLSPYLKYDAPTQRPDAGQSAWYSVSVKRIVGLSILNAFGLHIFDGLPVLAFPVPVNLESVTATYSFRMQKNFAPHADYGTDIRSVSRPMQVIVGGADELFFPERFGEVFGAIPVAILPEMGHSDMVTRPEAIRAVVQAVSGRENAAG
jgi:non-heme chloroperoxidase